MTTKTALNRGPVEQSASGAGRTRKAWLSFSPGKAFGVAFAGLAALLLIRSNDLFWKVIYEESDLAANSIITLQAKHFELLVGNYSRMGFSHPGPGFFYVQALGEWLFHDVLGVVPSPWNGQAVAILTLNAVMLAIVVGITSQWVRSWAAVAATTGTILAFLAFTDRLIQHPDPMNSPINSTWMPDAYFAPFLVLLVASASVAAGRSQELWAVALAGGFLVHGHAEFLFFVPVIVLVALAALLVRRRHGIGRDLWLALGIAGVFLIPIVLNLILNWPGEFADYFAYGGRNEPHSLAESARYVLLFWAMPRTLGLAIAVVLLIATVALAVRLRGLGILWTGAAVAVLASALFLYYTRTGIDMLSEIYIGQFYRAVPLLLCVLVAAGLSALARWRNLGVGLLAAGLVGGFTSPALANRRIELPDMPVVLAEVRARAGDRPVVLRLNHGYAWAEAVPLIISGTRAGMRVCLNDTNYEFMVTAQYICTPAEASAGAGFEVARREFPMGDGAFVAKLGLSDVRED